MEILIDITISLLINMGRKAIFIILMLPIQKYEMSFYFVVSP